ncbi:hypothetical protein [Sphingomonas crocodyli]|uniref:Sel1 repeat family protein n=1 Tax=Sphingomonas crocodyli TaxID=1979270 RepID=A0A437LVN4_9SPHN|nr:hypothetical protein [Sphingomonas crocodyli]RVT89446.1 hypothetical protein EOD43_22040 [Sphingomonas crocodyli]
MTEKAGISGTILLLLSAFMLTGVAPAAEPGQLEVRNYTTPGNLESPHDIGCIPLSAASPKYNPVDLYRGAKLCLNSGRYQEAFALIGLANAYGRFDMLRVADRTAHQAVTMARMEVFRDTPDAVKSELSAVVAKNSDNAEKRADLCRELRRLGHPTYYPRYMVQHGMAAFMQRGGEELVGAFDKNKAWSDVLNTYAKCA